ncbi:MAG TPA: hypothetical protein VHG08_13935 [Longimicrobium sp.]|nr:hypothetical protein [Longimicrobium sp.]
MAVRYLNASTRPLLTAIAILAGLLVLGAILSAALDGGFSAGEDASAARSAFTRRMDVLPTIVVTAPATP